MPPSPGVHAAITEEIMLDKTVVRNVLEAARAEGRQALTAPEGKLICDAYGIAVPQEGVAGSAGEAASLASSMGFPVVMKIVSPDILHKTEAGGVIVGVKSAEEARASFDKIIANAQAYKADAEIVGVQVQQMLTGGLEVIIGAVTDDSFGKLVAFGLGGVLVEVLKDITFRLAPVTHDEALSMLDSIQAAEMLKGVRGGEAVNRIALADMIVQVSKLVDDYPEISELDLNPVFATREGAIAADVRIVVDYNQAKPRHRPSQEEILKSMNRIMRPKAVAVIGASAEDGKIGNSVMKNLINGGYKGQIYPIHPKAEEILGYKTYKSVKDVPGDIDTAVFAIPAKLVAGALAECGEKKIPGAVLIPSGFAEAGEPELQDEIVKIGRKYNIRLMGPNIYGFYYTPENLCATFCTAYDVKGSAALSSQSGGIGMAIIGFSRSAKMGVSAIVGLGNKSDIDEDDLLTFFEQDDNTRIIAQHLEDLKDGRAFAEAAKRVSQKNRSSSSRRDAPPPVPKRPPRIRARLPVTTRSTRTFSSRSASSAPARCGSSSNSPAAFRSCQRRRAKMSSSSLALAARAYFSPTPASITASVSWECRTIWMRPFASSFRPSVPRAIPSTSQAANHPSPTRTRSNSASRTIASTR